MEDLLLKQDELTGAIEREITNFKKEGAERRAASAEQRLKKLKGLYQDFYANHLILLQYEDRTGDYFTRKHYERTTELYNEWRTYIEKHVKSSGGEGSGSGANGGGAETKINELLDEKLRRQAANYKAFQRTVSTITVDAITERWEFDDVLKKLESRWAAIDALHWEIESELEGKIQAEFEITFNTHEKQYNSLKTLINKKMWSQAHRDKCTPQLEVPHFHGNYNQWVSFKDLFTEAIHNNLSLSNAQKMQFLKGKVRGEAERLIQHLQISSSNYMVCWEILNNRYNNKRVIFTTHINLILDLPNVKQQSLSLIKRMYDVTQESLNAIKNLGVNIDTWDPLIVHILDQKLDAETHTEYIESLKDRRELPVLKDFLEFLEAKFTALESSRRKPENNQLKIYNQQSNMPSTSYGKIPYNYNQANKPTPISKSTYNILTIKCPLCNNNHGLYNCKNFLELSSEQKLQTLKELKVCINCLYHHGPECKSTKVCRKCSKKHNTLLHDVLKTQTPATSSVTLNMQNNNTYNNSKVNEKRNQTQTDEVLLSTAIIKVKGLDGTYHNLRALIDQGSQVSLITERAAQQLKIRRSQCYGSIFGVGQNEKRGKGRIKIECHSINTDFKFHTDVIIMNNLVGNLPNKSFSKPEWTFIENISLADPEFYISRPIDILFGADIYSNIIQEGIIKGKDVGQPIVQQTSLGWLLCGGVKTYKCNVLLHDFEDMKKFWQIEEISEQNEMSMEEQKCINFYKETTVRKEDGRYEIRLPQKENIENKLGDSKQTARAQFLSLEKKLQRQPKLANEYKTFMNEYVALNHMRVITTRGNTTPEYYMPHHGIVRNESLTTQYRVVFNASNKTSSGCSLNDLMYAGPNLQMDLQTLLLRWRQYRYAFTADIEKMFRMILINEDDQKYQKIFWRESPEEPVQTFCLTTVTYGTRAAPFLAMMTLKKLAADERERYPEAAKVVETSFYMDDLLYGTDSIESGQKLITELNLLTKSGGFNLRKWNSNENKLLEVAKQTINKSEEKLFNFKTDNIFKTLGLCWNPTKDTFTFRYNATKTTSTLTKRILLSEVSKVFDPLGWLAPLTTKLKLLFQRVWKEDRKWDEEVSDDIRKEWSKIKTELDIISEYEIPRWLRCHKNDVIELHGFCDASLEAYGCVVYAKKKGETTPILLTGKTKLVPHKKAITLPKLELSGAHLLSKLMNKIKGVLSEHNLEVYGWTDSMVVLGWLQGEPSRWKAFVSHRVQQTTDVIPGEHWRYVKSNENPADAATRGLYPTQLKDFFLWWQGPKWLATYQHEQEQTETYETNEEVKLNCTNVVKKQGNLIEDLLNKYSSFNKTVRIVARLLRTFVPTRTRAQLPNYLTLQELCSAKMLIIKTIQQNEFEAEMELLSKNRKIETNSNLTNLHPFIDKTYGVLRVGGRLENSSLNFEMKHPVIIPKNSRLAELIIDEAHLLTFHGGPRLTLANIRIRYWIPGGTNVVKKQLRNCVTCRRNNPMKQYQLMGDLPAARTDPAPPFFHTGVDYTGSVNIKANKTRNAKSMKGYIAVFICMVTKAVHLELVSDLTSSAFLAALRRMSARRGAPRHLYSDCGTNFVGANRALQEEYEQLQQTFDENFIGVLANMNIEWHFNAPSWPSAGGLWERAVRSLKHHLRRVVGEQRLTFEEYSTILAQLEACLNTRPLCALTEDVDDLNILTPAHFLTGRAGVTVIKTDEDARTRWYLMNEIFEQTWKKWKTEYLTQLSARNKWVKPQRNMEVGDLVIIRDENLPAGKWPRGRVVELHPERDGLVRVVTLKTESGYIKRPIVKLCLLLSIEETEKKSKTGSKQN